MSERKLIEEAREKLAARIIADTTTRADVEWIVDSLDVVTAERDEASVALEAALAREQRKDEALREIGALAAWYATMHQGPAIEVHHALKVEVLALVEDALAAVPVETQGAAAPDDYSRPGWRMFPVL